VPQSYDRQRGTSGGRDMQMKQMPDMRSWTEREAWPEMKSWAEHSAWPEMKSWTDTKSWPGVASWVKKSRPEPARCKRRWSDLSTAQQIGVIVMGVAQLILLAGGLWDLAHRKQEELRGDRRFWWGFMFVNWIGPIAYFSYGRKNSPLRPGGHKAEAPAGEPAEETVVYAESLELDGPEVE
jgi:hypothetical protein